MVNHGHLNVVHGQTRTTRLSPWSNMDTYMQTMVRTSKTIMSMVFDGLVLHTSMDFDGCSWISMVDHQIPCSPWSFMVTISPGLSVENFRAVGLPKGIDLRSQKCPQRPNLCTFCHFQAL